MSVSIPYQQNSYKTVDRDGHSPTWARVVAIFVSHFDWWTSHLKERKMGQVRARFSKHISSNLDQIAWSLPVADIHASRTDFALFDVASWARLDNTSSIMFLTHETRVGVEKFFHFEGNYFLSNINNIFTETFFFQVTIFWSSRLSSGAHGLQLQTIEEEENGDALFACAVGCAVQWHPQRSCQSTSNLDKQRRRRTRSIVYFTPCANSGFQLFSFPNSDHLMFSWHFSLYFFFS